MPQKQPYEDEATNKNAIDAERLKAIFGKECHKPFHSKQSHDKMQMNIRVVCGKGTYIRALARDMGRALGSGAYLTMLRRTRVGDFTKEKCVDFDHIREWLDKQEKERI
jgi:tRNA pseudouridine(55) synthase